MRCKLCPRRCAAARDGPGSLGVCKSGRTARIARAALHRWEEPPVSGKNGSGAVFFTGCPLGCLYCQNYEISSMENRGRAVSPEELSAIFFQLVEEGAHNINLVTPTHYIPQIRQALKMRPLPVPVVYNTSGYERPESLRALEGLVDIYLPDYKYAQGDLAGALSGAEDYPERAVEAIGEMLRQVGLPAYDENGMMLRGVMIRHLILPGHTKNSLAVLRSIAERFPGVPVSLMAQYTPWGMAKTGIAGYPELSRGITKRELEKVEGALFDLGLEGFVQSRKARGAEYIPDFAEPGGGTVKPRNRLGGAIPL